MRQKSRDARVGGDDCGMTPENVHRAYRDGSPVGDGDDNHIAREDVAKAVWC